MNVTVQFNKHFCLVQFAECPKHLAQCHLHSFIGACALSNLFLLPFAA